MPNHLENLILPESVNQPIPITSDPVLLLDGHVVAGTQGCRQTFHGATKDPASPILTATEPWEGHGPYTWGTRLLWNPDTRQYYFYYIAYAPPEDYRWGLAVSDDGLTWSKPNLGIETLNGRPARNMLTSGPHPEKAGRTVVRDPRPECPPAERFKAIRFTYDGEFMSYSPDGRRWTEDPDNPLWHVPSDCIHAMWDPLRQRFVTYYKIWELTGETPDSAQPGGWRPVTLYMPTFDHKLRPDGLTEIRGPAVTFHPESQATVKPVRVLLRTASQGKDDGGGGPLTGVWHCRRVIAWAESDDWRHWRHERVIMKVDERDRPDANIQYVFVMPYGGYYLAFPTMHDERGHFEQQFAFSRDGLSWSRPWRGNFIGLGPPDSFDSGMVLAPTDPILTETQMVFYYGGFDILHHQNPNTPWKSAIGRAMIRRDGFASWDSLPGQAGVVTTKPLTTRLPELWVNADAGGGRLLVEVLDENGRVLPGFEAAACRPIVEDTSRCPGCRAPVTWTPGNAATTLVDRPFRLRFLLDNARLFAFGFQLPATPAIAEVEITRGMLDAFDYAFMRSKNLYQVEASGLNDLLAPGTKAALVSATAWDPGLPNVAVLKSAGDTLDLAFNTPGPAMYRLVVDCIAGKPGPLTVMVDGTALKQAVSIWQSNRVQTVRLDDVKILSARPRLTLRHEGGVGLVSLRPQPAPRPLPASVWMTIGPFATGYTQESGLKIETLKAAFATLYPPEKEINFEAVYQGAGNKPIRWRHVDAVDAPLMKHGLDFRICTKIPNLSLNMCLGVTYITSPEERKAELSVTCDYWANAYLNGEMVQGDRPATDSVEDGAQFTGYNPIPIRAQVTLRKGVNTLLVKNHGGTGSNWIIVWITDPGDLKFSSKPA